MKYYIDRSTGARFAYELDGSQDDIIRPDLELLSREELDQILAEEEAARGPTIEQITAAARAKRDSLLVDTYDRGISIAQRVLRMAESDAEKVIAQAKIAELDLYAIALQNVPDQPGFPESITWPEVPSYQP